MQLQEVLPLRDSQEFYAITVTWFNCFRIQNVMILKRMVILILCRSFRIGSSSSLDDAVMTGMLIYLPVTLSAPPPNMVNLRDVLCFSIMLLAWYFVTFSIRTPQPCKLWHSENVTKIHTKFRNTLDRAKRRKTSLCTSAGWLFWTLQPLSPLQEGARSSPCNFT